MRKSIMQRKRELIAQINTAKRALGHRDQLDPGKMVYHTEYHLQQELQKHKKALEALNAGSETSEKPA